VTGFSVRRFLAVLREEWIPIRRDPFTLRMIIALPSYGSAKLHPRGLLLAWL
jgi:hypothetical protein